MKKFILIILLFLFAVSFPKTKALAADLTVTCNNSGCSPTLASSFFPNSEVWYPGKTLTKSIKVDNQSGATQTVKVGAQNQSPTGNLDTVMDMEISLSGNNLWRGTLTSFYQSSNIALSDIPAGSFTEYNFTVSMQTTAGNQYQGITTAFDLVLFFPSYSNPTPTPTITPTPTQASAQVESNPTETPVPNPTSTPVPGPTETPGPGPTDTPGPNPTNTPAPTVFFPVFGGNEGFGGTENNTLGKENPAPTGIILGAVNPETHTDGASCSFFFWWMLIIAGQTIGSALHLYSLREQNQELVLTGEILLTLSSIIFLGQYFCLWWVPIISGAIGLATIYVTYRRITLSPGFSQTQIVS